MMEKLNSEAALQESRNLIANAIENAVKLHNEGRFASIGHAFEKTEVQVSGLVPDFDPLTSLSLRFWDEWADAANHDWKYHGEIGKKDWPLYAQVIISALRQGKYPEDSHIVNQFGPKPGRSLLQRLKDQFTRK